MSDMLETMRAAVLVAETRNLSAAARRLGITHTAVSKRINELEWRLGAALFTRTTRHIGLTDVGEIRLRSIKRVLAEVDEMLSQTSDPSVQYTGRLVVKCPTTPFEALFEEIFLRFRRRFPGVIVDAQFVNRQVHPLQEGFDVVFSVLPTRFPGVVEEKIGLFEQSIVIGGTEDAHRRIPTCPDDLTGCECVVFTPFGTHWTFSRDGHQSTVRIQPVFSTNSMDLLMKLVRAGTGIALVPSVLLDKSEETDLKVLLTEWRIEPLLLKAMVPDYRLGAQPIQGLLSIAREILEHPQA
ncbi:LysR family transcriptional regulator [Paraburkholderia phytofirmans]|uniref:HTH lysR-type domain-containing protein n=1 Tax=Paraburkholderia phytofirmans OLGA172 TaxID=1417228 RepID=A0A160FHX6_9BURK|nr:LysR family transcriptional regulator [Paraburkholderia phytofirmans]ANB71772.1 hypothetical protein AYM40_04825 [Paraburkholderia phytofirmans OLGA172]